jgi:hypothetical protein
MTPATIGKFVETVGIPAAGMAAAGFLAWYLLRWMTGNLGKQMGEIKQEIKNETDDLHAVLRSQQVMLVRLIDRVRTLELNLQTTWTAALTALDAEPPTLRRTRAEVLAELKEQMLDVAHNGEADE